MKDEEEVRITGAWPPPHITVTTEPDGTVTLSGFKDEQEAKVLTELARRDPTFGRRGMWEGLLERWRITGNSPIDGRRWRHWLPQLEAKCIDAGDDTLWEAYSVLRAAYELARGATEDRKRVPALLGLNEDPSRLARDYYLASLAQTRINAGVPTSGHADRPSAFETVVADFNAWWQAVQQEMIADGRLSKAEARSVRDGLRNRLNDRAVQRAYYTTFREHHPDWSLMVDPEREDAVMWELWDLVMEDKERPASAGL